MELLLLDAHGPSYWALKFILNALALMAGAHFLNGVRIDDFVRAMLVAIVLAVLNATLGGVLDFITTPLRYLTLGLFSFVVDGALLLIAAYFLKGFHIDNFKSAFFLAILLAIFNTVLYGIFL